MFEAWLPLKTPLERLMWLRRVISGGASWVWRSITGAAPLTLHNAVSRAIKSLTQYGLCTQSTTPTPDSPVDIVCNNGAVRYGALTSNLYDPDPAFVELGYYRNNGEKAVSKANFIMVKNTPVEARKSYVFYGRKKNGGELAEYCRVYWFDANGEYISTGPYTKKTVTIAPAPANAAFAQFGVNESGTSTSTVTQDIVDSYNWYFGEGTEEPAAFVPYEAGIIANDAPEVLTVTASGATPQTVTDIPNLFAVGDYADEVDIISGTVTRKVGLWVLNGQEAWELNSVYGETDNAFLARSAVPFVANSKKLLCSHFVNKASVQTAGNVSVGVFGGSQITFFCGKDSNINSVDAWTAFLGAQYAAGTPVIVIYPLAEETTEQTAPHALRTSEGTNTVSVTSNVDPVELEVEYATTEV